jgi:hypothetical protein
MLATEEDMRACISLAVGGLGFSIVLLSPSSLTAATKTAFEGKKVCWEGSAWNNFYPGGKVTSNIAGEGTWAARGPGAITVKFPSGPYSGIITTKAGGMVEYSGSWTGTPAMTIMGAFCN